MSTYEEDLRQELKTEFNAGRLREVGNSASVFAALVRIFPVVGSKIDWKNVPNAVEEIEEDLSRHSEHFIAFFERICSRFGLTGPVIYVGDSATNFVLEGALDSIRYAMPVLFDIPQHHYFVGPNYSWCASMTMEGDMCFGRAIAVPNR